MNIGKTLFAQIMDFLPWSTFDRILPGEFGSANRTAVISSRYRSLYMSHPCIRARARYLCKNSLFSLSWISVLGDRSGPIPKRARCVSLCWRYICALPAPDPADMLLDFRHR